MRPGLLVPVALLATFVYVMANRGWHGGGKWFLASFGLAVVMAFIVPKIPGSPISCMAHPHPLSDTRSCQSQSSAVFYAFAACLLPAFLGTIGRERG
jgi:hypothetical protein